MKTMALSLIHIYDEDGIKLDIVKEIKEVRRARIKEYVDAVPTAVYTEGKGIWTIPCDIALPCATQNLSLIHIYKPSTVGIISGDESSKSSIPGWILPGKRTINGIFIDSE